MSEIPAFSPGCFGSALAFREGDPVCSNCAFTATCKPMHLANKEALQRRFGLTPVLRAPSAAASQPSVDPASMTLPKKVQELITRLDSGEYRVIDSLAAGINPFEGKGMSFMRLVCHLLLRIDGSLNREVLSTAFVTKLGHKEETADAHARMAIQALTHIGAVQNTDGNIRLRRR